MGRTRQDRTKIKEEKKKRQNSDYEASLKKPKVSTNPPTCQTTETKQTHTKKRKKEKKSQQGGHFEDLKGYKKIPKQQQQKGQKIWLSHV